MAREPALHAPLPPATRRADMRLLRRRVALLSERIHPLLSQTTRWRSGFRFGNANSKTLAAPARRPPKRTCSSSPLSEHVVAVGLRCEKANSRTLLPGYEVAVGLRCGKVNTKTPRSFARLDSVFPHDSSGCSIFFPIKEESTRLATSSSFSKRPNGTKPSRVGHMLPPTRAPLMKTPTGSTGPAPSSCTLTHMHQAASLPVKQVE